MDFAEVVHARRMTRAFSPRLVQRSLIDNCVGLAARSPSAGKTQGWNLVVVEGDQTRRYWDVALPADKRDRFGFPGLLDAPWLAIVTADPSAYLSRYSEPDKSRTGLGVDLEAWPAPYWTVDASFATMTLLYAFEDAGLGALFFAHAHEDGLRAEFAIPDHIQIIGTVCAGYRADDSPPGRSASRSRRDPGEIIRPGRW